MSVKVKFVAWLLRRNKLPKISYSTSEMEKIIASCKLLLVSLSDECDQQSCTAALPRSNLQFPSLSNTISYNFLSLSNAKVSLNR